MWCTVVLNHPCVHCDVSKLFDYTYTNKDGFDFPVVTVHHSWGCWFTHGYVYMYRSTLAFTLGDVCIQLPCALTFLFGEVCRPDANVQVIGASTAAAIYHLQLLFWVFLHRASVATLKTQTRNSLPLQWCHYLYFCLTHSSCVEVTQWWTLAHVEKTVKVLHLSMPSCRAYVLQSIWCVASVQHTM